MNESLSLSTDEFLEYFNPQKRRILAILSFAMLNGIAMFLGVVIFMASKPVPPNTLPTANEEQFAMILSVVNVALIIGSLMGSIFIPKLLLTSLKQIQPVQSAEEKGGIYRKAAQLFNTSSIIRLAILESGALFGIIVCLLANQSGVLKQTPALWLNVIPAGIFAIMMLVLLPSEIRLRNWFESEVQPLFNPSSF